MRSSSSIPGRLIPAALALVALLLPRESAAQSTGGWQLSLDTDARWIERLPPFQGQQAVLADGQTLSPNLPSAGSATMMNVNMSVGCTVNDRWVIPLLGAGVGWAIGPHPRVWTNDQGVAVSMQPWSTRAVAVFLPGAGIRMKHRRWMFQFSVVPGVRFWMMDAIAGRDQDVKVSTGAITFGVVAQIETCRRLDPTHRACLLLSPVIYEQQFGNGGSIGLRWELGP
jgi:hypothetical protein